MLSTALFGATVSGTVGSADGAIPFTKLHIEELNKTAFSDEKGNYLFDAVPKGSYQLIVSASGFMTDTLTLHVRMEEDTVYFDVFLRRPVTEIGEVTIRAQAKETELDRGPVTMTVISPKLFERNPTPSIFESMAMVNGVRPQMQCNVCSTGDIHINGMEGPYTVVMIDGMPIVSALGTVYGLMGIPNSIIERVEVQKGPSSVLFGSEAVGGLINVITKKPESAPLFSANVVSTTYSDHTIDLSYRFGIGKRIKGLISGNSFIFNKRWDINSDNFTDITLQNRVALFGKLSIDHKKGNSSSIAVRYLYEDRWGGEMNWDRRFRGGDSIYGESIYTNRFELIGTTPLSSKREPLNLQYSLIGHEQNSAYGTSTFLADQYIGFAQLTKKFVRTRHVWLMGLVSRYTYYDDNTIITERIEDSITVINTPSKTFLPGVFIQDEFKLNEKNVLLAGLRADHHSAHGVILSPRLNWKNTFRKKHIFRLGFGNGFRVVNLFSEDHAAFTGAREVVILGDLKPERSWNGNLNYNSVISKGSFSVSYDMNGFYNYFSNKIVADYFTDNNKVIFDNLNGYGICRGFGLNLHIGMGIPLKINLGTTFSDVYLMEDDGNGSLIRTEQVQTPKWTSNFVLTYMLCKINTTIDLTGNVYSPMLLPVLENDYRPAYSPTFGLVNLQITTLLGKKWQLYGGVKNLLNYLPSEDPIMRPFDPFDKYVDDPINNPNGYTFDPGYNYAPMQGIRGFVGLKYQLE
jgi:outer membrane receptor for ferrienterochelin and colicins